MIPVWLYLQQGMVSLPDMFQWEGTMNVLQFSLLVYELQTGMLKQNIIRYGHGPRGSIKFTEEHRPLLQWMLV